MRIGFVGYSGLDLTFPFEHKRIRESGFSEGVLQRQNLILCAHVYGAFFLLPVAILTGRDNCAAKLKIVRFGPLLVRNMAVNTALVRCTRLV